MARSAFVAGLVFASLLACKDQPSATSAPAASAASSDASTSGPCKAARKRLAECDVTPEKAKLGEPCDERMAACLAGQGCEAIRAGETGCVFH